MVQLSCAAQRARLKEKLKQKICRCALPEVCICFIFLPDTNDNLDHLDSINISLSCQLVQRATCDLISNIGETPTPTPTPPTTTRTAEAAAKRSHVSLKCSLIKMKHRKNCETALVKVLIVDQVDRSSW